MPALTGCSTYVSQLEGQAFEPVDPAVSLLSERPSNGAIFRSRSKWTFATDQRARRVGDILTVTFNEIFAGNQGANCGVEQSGCFCCDTADGFAKYFDRRALTMMRSGNGAGLTAGTNRTFAGAGNAAQSNSFTGSLAVTVTRVFPNGNMEVAGQKEITLNNGNEYVRVKGIVRPEDISATNIVSSTRLADAQIRYTGSGHLADASKPGWLSQLMRAISPF